MLRGLLFPKHSVLSIFIFEKLYFARNRDLKVLEVSSARTVHRIDMKN